ncbi:unnamed protein product [Urochloa humidicola]
MVLLSTQPRLAPYRTAGSTLSSRADPGCRVAKLHGTTDAVPIWWSFFNGAQARMRGGTNTTCSSVAAEAQLSPPFPGMV